MSLVEVLQSGNYHLIDVREPMELEMDGHIEAAQNIPLGELEDRKQEILNLSGFKIFFCRRKPLHTHRYSAIDPEKRRCAY